MIGLGETESELLEAMADLRLAKCDLLPLGQYLQPSLCHLPVAEYDRSLTVLRKAKERSGGTIYTKSGLMLGLGETESELLEAMADLRLANCDILTLGQYLQPSRCHLPVVEYVTPGKFDEYGARARERGFRHVASGPMVRSSYHADEFELPSKA